MKEENTKIIKLNIKKFALSGAIVAGIFIILMSLMMSGMMNMMEMDGHMIDSGYMLQDSEIMIENSKPNSMQQGAMIKSGYKCNHFEMGAGRFVIMSIIFSLISGLFFGLFAFIYNKLIGLK